MEKTLGGDRLGGGKKMKVEIEGFGRSNHDLSKVVKTTMSPGTLVPVYTNVTTPGDDNVMRIRAKIQTNPTVGSLYGSYIFGVDVFGVDFRLYIGGLQYNAQNLATNMQYMKIPQVRVKAKTNVEETDNSQVGSSCVLKYLGIKGVGNQGSGWTTSIARDFNAVPLIAYYDIFRNYYANKQEENCYMIHTEALETGASGFNLEMNGEPIAPTLDGYATIEINTNATLTYTGQLNIDNIRIKTAN